MATIGAVALALCVEFQVCLFFILGMVFARYRPTLRLSRRIELVMMPVCLAGYYYAAQFIGFSAALLLSAVLFLAVISNDTLTARLLGTRVLQFLGKISYSLYLVHPFAVFPFQMIGSALVHRGVNHGHVFLFYLPVPCQRRSWPPPLAITLLKRGYARSSPNGRGSVGPFPRKHSRSRDAEQSARANGRASTPPRAPSAVIRRSIAVRTFDDWDDPPPGSWRRTWSRIAGRRPGEASCKRC